MFSRAVPVPNYVRRDGTLNIASHFQPTPLRPIWVSSIYGCKFLGQTTRIGDTMELTQIGRNGVGLENASNVQSTIASHIVRDWHSTTEIFE